MQGQCIFLKWNEGQHRTKNSDFFLGLHPLEKGLMPMQLLALCLGQRLCINLSLSAQQIL